MALAILFAAAVYLPAAMGFWYAAPLTVWQSMGVCKALIGKTIAAMMVMLPLSVVLTVVMYCSFYATCSSVFGRPAAGVPA
jgi:hypothetical protein